MPCGEIYSPVVTLCDNLLPRGVGQVIDHGLDVRKKLTSSNGTSLESREVDRGFK